MLIRKSTYVHLVDVTPERVLILHAVTQARLVVDPQVARLVAWFATPRDLPAESDALLAAHHLTKEVASGCLGTLMEHRILTDKDAATEAAETADHLAQWHGRDPGEALDALRRNAKQGADPYWSVVRARGASDLGRTLARQAEVLLFGDCDLQMEADFLRQAGATRGLDLRIATGFPDDLRLAGERPHSAILVGALRSRRMVAQGSVADHGGDPTRVYLAEVRAVIEGLRARSAAPILIDNLPEPTVQPLGFAERGPQGHRNRFRAVNLGLDALAADYPDVHVVDISAALAAEGAGRLLDDGLVGFTHFGSPGWMLQRPQAELAAVHGLFPDLAPLAARLGHVYGREEVTARAHMDALAVVLGLDRKKCVILDLDGTLWPGVLAETGAPFNWTPEVSGPNSYVGLYFGLHEALKALKRRGILLACVSKNDEALVRELWRYPDHYPRDRLLTPDDFVTWRVNWQDKAANIAAIAAELGFALDAFVFIDDHPVERERVRQALPEVEVWGDDPFALRQMLLSDPRLQVTTITPESAARTALVRTQLDRDRQRIEAGNTDAFLASLEVTCTIDQPRNEEGLARVVELFQRTTQFNTTGKRFSLAEMAAHARAGELFIAHVRDRFGDYGLVAACVVHAGEITAFAMSCRVIGLQVEHRLLADVMHATATHRTEICGRIVATERNGRVRHLYADNGFTQDGEWWRRALPALRKAS